MAEILLNDTVMVTDIVASTMVAMVGARTSYLGVIGRVTVINSDAVYIEDVKAWFYKRELTRFYSYAFLSSRSSNELKGAQPK